jgi:hypothetical protein
MEEKKTLMKDGVIDFTFPPQNFTNYVELNRDFQ